MRGEDSIPGVDMKIGDGSPPHARGRHRDTKAEGTSVGITPACAGKTSAAGRQTHSMADHPRMRGEDYHRDRDGKLDGGSPPHARGRRFDDDRVAVGVRITPACAGKTPCNHTAGSYGADHPRMRGEDLGPARPKPLSSRITPACAGKTCVCARVCVACPDHPRMRGEDS